MLHPELNRPAGYTIRTWAWADAITRFDEFKSEKLRPMQRFIAEIAASQFSSGLFPAASMDAVLVARIENFPVNEPHLRLWYNYITRQVTFTYFSDTYAPRWETKVPVARAFEHFRHLMVRRLRWYRDRGHGSNTSLERTRDR